MKMFCVAILFLAVAVVVSRADETNTLPTTITVDGVAYSNVTWRTATPSTVSILHRTGVASIPLQKLTPDLQKRFGYNPDRAKEYREQEMKAEAQRQQRIKLQNVRARYVRKIGGKLYDFTAVEQLLSEERQWRESGSEWLIVADSEKRYGPLPELLARLQEVEPAWKHWSDLCGKIVDCQKVCVAGVVRSVQDGALLVECKSPYYFYTEPSVPLHWDYAWVMNYPGARNTLNNEKASASALWTSNRDGKRVYDCGTLPTDDELLSLPVEQVKVK